MLLTSRPSVFEGIVLLDYSKYISLILSRPFLTDSQPVYILSMFLKFWLISLLFVKKKALILKKKSEL